MAVKNNILLMKLNNLPCLVIDSINYLNSNSPATVNYDICQQMEQLKFM